MDLKYDNYTNLTRMKEVIMVFVCQIGNAFFRGWNINSLSSKDAIGARISWMLFGVTHLISISISVKSFLESNWVVVVFWFIGGFVGQEISMMRLRK